MATATVVAMRYEDSAGITREVPAACADGAWTATIPADARNARFVYTVIPERDGPPTTITFSHRSEAPDAPPDEVP